MSLLLPATPSLTGDGSDCRRHCPPSHRALPVLLAIAVIAAAPALSGCHRAPGGAGSSVPGQSENSLGFLHRVSRGEKLRDISRRYDRSPELLAWLNELDPPWQIERGGYIYVPPDNSTGVISSGRMTLLDIRRLRQRPELDEILLKSSTENRKLRAQRASPPTALPKERAGSVPHKRAVAMKTFATAPQPKARTPKASAKPKAPKASPRNQNTASASPKQSTSSRSGDRQNRANNTPQAVSARGFSWPLQGAWVRGFSETWPRAHAGVDISAPEGTEIRAAADGLVFLSDNLGSYGNLVVIEHANGLASVYAHNSKNLVIEGDEVRRGDLIAYVGSTGNATGPHCHFELRLDGEAVDPMAYLPPLDQARAVAEQSESGRGLIGWLR